MIIIPIYFRSTQGNSCLVFLRSANNNSRRSGIIGHFSPDPSLAPTTGTRPVSLCWFLLALRGEGFAGSDSAGSGEREREREREKRERERWRVGRERERKTERERERE